MVCRCIHCINYHALIPGGGCTAYNSNDPWGVLPILAMIPGGVLPIIAMIPGDVLPIIAMIPGVYCL